VNAQLINGEWEGFYNYTFNSSKHTMEMTLNFNNGKVSGNGADDVGVFSFNGNYDQQSHKIYMTKRYATHIVNYDGNIDENGIWGMWNIDEYCRGGFHIWPKKSKKEDAKESLVEKKEILTLKV
jgi:hypothetical protein